MRIPSTLATLLACVPACIAAMPAHAKTRIIATGAEAAVLLDDIGLPRRECPFKQQFDLVGEFDIPGGYSGSVGEFVTPSTRYLRIDSAISHLDVASHLPSWQVAGAIGTWTHDAFAWRPMGSIQDGLFWAYPYPGKRKAVPIYADQQALVKLEVNRSGNMNVRALAYFGVRGCMVGSIPPG